MTDLNHWAPHWSPLSSARDAELLGQGCGPHSSSVLSFPGDSNGLPGLGTTTLHHLSCKPGIFIPSCITDSCVGWEAMDPLYRKMFMYKKLHAIPGNYRSFEASTWIPPRSWTQMKVKSVNPWAPVTRPYMQVIWEPLSSSDFQALSQMYWFRNHWVCKSSNMFPDYSHTYDQKTAFALVLGKHHSKWCPSKEPELISVTSTSYVTSPSFYFLFRKWR